MGYSAGESLFLLRLQAMDQFDGKNSGRGTFGMRNSGASDQYAVLKPGVRMRTKHGMGGKKRIVHQTIVQLYQQFVEGEASLKNLETLVGDVEAELDKYPRMGDGTNTVIQANITEVREAQEIYESAAAKVPLWLYVELVGEWHEEVEITYAG